MNRIGLVLSHIFVRPEENYKFNMVEYCVSKMRSLDNFHVVLCGHGLRPDGHAVLDLIDDLYWEDEIKTDEIGRGHPHFCRAGFDICKANNLSKTLKLRAFDYINNKEIFNSLKNKQATAIFSEQTSIEKEFLGDLFMFGDTSFLLDLWSYKWDYSKSGLVNLYHSILNIDSHFTNNFSFISPQDIGWFTAEGCWDDSNKKPTDEKLWGQLPGFSYYGGF
jgi:hypothetical protein